MPRHSQDQDPAASAVEKNEKCRCSRHAAFLGCLADAATNTSLLQVAEATKFREIFTFFKTATCPQSYHLQAALRIFSPSNVNMSRNFVDSSTAAVQSCFKVAAVFPFVLQLAAVPAVVLPGFGWFSFHI